MKARCKHRGRPSTLSSRLARRVTQLKQKAAAQRGAPSAGMLHCRGTHGEEDASRSHCRQGRKGGYRGDIYAHIFCPLSSILKLSHTVDPSDLHQDWAAGRTVKRKRGRKPEVLMGVNPKRAHYKDGRATEKQEVREEKSDIESSDCGELQYRSHTRIFSV